VVPVFAPCGPEVDRNFRQVQRRARR